jgi:hypothetical protein
MVWDRDGYGGTLAPNVVVPGLSRQLVITAVDVWGHTVQLRGTAEVDRATPFWFPSAWGVATDLGSTHVSTVAARDPIRGRIASSRHFQPGLKSYGSSSAPSELSLRWEASCPGSRR